MWGAFWAWYERNYTLNLSIAVALFLVQIFHLVWLFGEVVWAHLFGTPLLTLGGTGSTVMALVDYGEIPAILSVSLVYINELRTRFSFIGATYLLFLNSQWLHIFWITDEFVVTAFNEAGTVLPLWLAWVGISIDYLEVPVMFDTGKKLLRAWRAPQLT
ncbi:hypothetical protein A2943_02320 [Candidatus Adlerbacteria bacterium RIFCSPLOWO2_01_FULL_51_16]|uniref:Ferric oxidoreductase domain-containing protein n=1 Tax=Candidatus Adlerbacteria bacterium RIFCSPLOWO2_01_FULL_51_16 TaxID=1797243 RepID=A0A1F4XGA2_9BACT|nr:MAG: hypothetical protein A2943_02320 [Candidatus Adlerbacteria bacterium RIFCSPLOWO2_01_FULL_51_16]